MKVAKIIINTIDTIGLLFLAWFAISIIDVVAHNNIQGGSLWLNDFNFFARF